jgi:hypothetical protein
MHYISRYSVNNTKKCILRRICVRHVMFFMFAMAISSYV